MEKPSKEDKEKLLEEFKSLSASIQRCENEMVALLGEQSLYFTRFIDTLEKIIDL